MIILGAAEPESIWEYIICFPILAGIIVFLYWLIHQVAASRLKPLARELGGEVVSSFGKGAYYKLVQEGVEFRVSLRSQGRSAVPDVIDMSVAAAFDFNLEVSKDDLISAGLAILKLKQDIEIGDQLFDIKYKVRSDHPDRAKNYLLDPAHREIIEDFFSQKFTSFTIDNEKATTSKTYFDNQDLEPQRVRERLHKLGQLLAGR